MTDIALSLAVRLILTLVTRDTMRAALSALVTIVEDAVHDTSNATDDALLLPLCARLRDELGLAPHGTPDDGENQ